MSAVRRGCWLAGGRFLIDVQAETGEEPRAGGTARWQDMKEK